MLRAFIIVFLAASLAAGCAREGEGGKQPQVAALEVRPATLRIATGASAQLVAQANDASGKPVGGAGLSFRLAGDELVRVGESGLVTALGRTGRTEVRVSSGTLERTVVVEVTAGAAAQVEFLEPEPEAVAGAPPGAVEARVSDGFGVPVAGTQVRFTVSEGSGTVDPVLAATDAAGIARTRWQAPKTSGDYTLQVTAGELPPQPLVLTVRAAAAAQIRIVGGDGQKAPAGSPASEEPRVRVEDRFGNPVPGMAVQFNAAPGSSIASSKVLTGPDGVASAGSWTLTAPGPHRLTVTAGGEGLSATLRAEATRN